MESPLANPKKKAGELSRNVRILAFDLATERVTAEYVYRFEPVAEFDPSVKAAPEEMKISELAAIGPHTLIVLERTDRVAKLYRVDLREATDIHASRWDDAATSPSLEATEDLAAADLTPLPKTLVIDLGSLPDVPDKIEGIAVIDRRTCLPSCWTT